MISHEFADVGGRFVRMLRHRVADQGLDLGGGHSGDRSDELRLALNQGRGDVVAIPEPVLAAVARGHAVAAVVEHAAQQQGLGAPSGCVMGCALFAEFGLDCLEQGPVQDRRLFAGADVALVDHLCDVEPIAQQMREGAPGERDAADRVR